MSENDETIQSNSFDHNWRHMICLHFTEPAFVSQMGKNKILNSSNTFSFNTELNKAILKFYHSVNSFKIVEPYVYLRNSI
jgi:hypothetical protein